MSSHLFWQLSLHFACLQTIRGPGQIFMVRHEFNVTSIHNWRDFLSKFSNFAKVCKVKLLNMPHLNAVFSPFFNLLGFAKWTHVITIHFFPTLLAIPSLYYLPVSYWLLTGGLRINISRLIQSNEKLWHYEMAITIHECATLNCILILWASIYMKNVFSRPWNIFRSVCVWVEVLLFLR